MRKSIIAILIFTLLSVGAYAQAVSSPAPEASAVASPTPAASVSLTENEFLLKAIEYQQKADAAIAAGDYDAAGEWARQSADYLARSDEYVDFVVRTDGISKDITKLDEKLAKVENSNGKVNFPEEYKAAKAAVAQAKDALTWKSYDQAEKSIQEAKMALSSISEEMPFPMYYKVRRLKHADCFWRIAGMPAVYGDPKLWPKLYAANKQKLRNPNNPNLIHPDMVFVIPSLWGEVREGYWDPNKVYPTLPNQAATNNGRKKE